MKKLVSLFLSCLLLLSFLPAVHAAAPISAEMKAMMDQKILMGDKNGDPAPYRKVTRGEFAALLQRALKLPNGQPIFKDVPTSSSLAQGINAAAKAKIVNGYAGNLFKPNDQITREQMAAMINNALDYLKVPAVTGKLTFADNSQIRSKTIVARMVGHKIIFGNTKNEFRPNDPATREHAAAFIYRMLQVKKNHDERTTTPPVVEPPATLPPVTPTPPGQPPVTPGDPIPPTVPVEKKAYILGTVDTAGKVTESDQSYDSFSEAECYFGKAANQVLLKDGKIIKMNGGVVIASATSGAATPIYPDATFTSHAMGLGPGNEMEYVSSDDTGVAVKVAGQPFYVKHTEVTLIPAATLASNQKSYYKVDANHDVYHYVYNYTKKTFTNYFYGKAPAAVAAGNYYSWDGKNFTNSNGVQVASFSQYFNMLPYRTATNYTAAELDQIIDRELKKVEALSSTDAQYKDATKKSKLLHLGQALKDAESTYKINALTVLSQAILESKYGMSAVAQSKNNIFGMSVIDGKTGSGTVFPDVKESIKELATGYLNKNYLPGDAGYANGAQPGNKVNGVNVRYASDQYWGQKIGGIEYRLDAGAGGKDYVNNPTPYQLYEVTSAVGLQVRSSAEVNESNKLYRYPRPGFVVAVLGSEKKSDYTWYQIISDSNTSLYGYVAGGEANEPYILPLNIAK
ncbi:S-layer homology domain-containing protein [Bacillus testis]|uniref:S-layer homology domain-containing protein n=1 Tax=Bacillus testis TaxID=1622072 RepID=UPI00067F0184|nr:S-layer homology domain-containing protein [Bacillus testis]